MSATLSASIPRTSEDGLVVWMLASQTFATFILKRHSVSRPSRALDLTAFLPYMQVASLTAETFRQITDKTLRALRASRQIASFPFRATSCNCKNVIPINEMNFGILLPLQHQDHCIFLPPLILHKLLFSIFFEFLISRLLIFLDFLSPSSFMIFQELIGVLIGFKNYKIIPIEALHKTLKAHLLDYLFCLWIQSLRDFWLNMIRITPPAVWNLQALSQR